MGEMTNHVVSSRRAFLGTAGAGGVGALAGCMSDLMGGNDTVRVGENRGNGIQSAEVLIAEEMGYDEEEGVKFETQTYGIGVDIMQGVAAGEIDYGIDGAHWAFLATAGAGGDICLPSQNWSFEPTSFVTPEGIQDFSDLQGKSIARIEGSVFDYLTASLLEEQDGISIDDVNLVNMSSGSDMLAALLQGEIAGAWLWTRFLWEAIEEEDGYHELVEGPAVESETIDSWGVLTMNHSWAQENTDRAASALKATQKAVDYINNETEDAAEIVANSWDLEKEEVLRTAESVGHYVGLPADNIEHMREMKNWGVEAGYIEEFNLDDAVYTEPGKKAFPDLIEL
jgi:ABC-type nitrate/sulfonate/bicarbonate transport system substrate-binding protein